MVVLQPGADGVQPAEDAAQPAAVPLHQVEEEVAQPAAAPLLQPVAGAHNVQPAPQNQLPNGQPGILDMGVCSIIILLLASTLT